MGQTRSGLKTLCTTEAPASMEDREIAYDSSMEGLLIGRLLDFIVAIAAIASFFYKASTSSNSAWIS